MKSGTRSLPKSEKVREAEADKGAHTNAVWAQLGNDSGVILKPADKK